MGSIIYGLSKLIAIWWIIGYATLWNTANIVDPCAHCPRGPGKKKHLDQPYHENKPYRFTVDFCIKRNILTLGAIYLNKIFTLCT